MILRQLIQALEPLQVEGSLDHEVSGITFDSRRVFPGMMFVAMPGRRTDGHEFIESAVDRGAAAVVCERGGFGTRKTTCIRVPDSRLALARTAATFYDHPSRRLKVIGITGTSGKTTVSFLVRHILESAGTRCGLIGTVRYEIGERTFPAQRTTPEAVEIQHLMAQMLRANCAACVLEVSSHALDQRRVEDVEFDVGVFTNLTHDHLDYHGSMENYFAAKRRLFDSLARGGKRAASVVNIDDAYGERLEAATGLAVRVSYGLGATATVRAEQLRLGPDGSQLRVRAGGEVFELRLPLIGRFNAYNVLAAVGTALVLGVPLAKIRTALESAPQVPGRLERMDLGQPFGVFVDYAHTEDALRNVLTSLREITAGRVLLGFGCGGGRDASKRAPMGRAAGELADLVVVTSDNPRHEDPQRIAADIAQGLVEAGRATWRVELDRARAIEELLRQARPGDTVLVAGKGHETFQEYADTVVPFDDRFHVGEVLESMGHALSAREDAA